MNEYHARNTENPDFVDVLTALEHAVWDSRSSEDVQYVVMNRALALAADPSARNKYAQRRLGWIKGLQGRLKDPYLNHQMEMFELDLKELEVAKPLEPTPGQPIGEGEEGWPF